MYLASVGPEIGRPVMGWVGAVPFSSLAAPPAFVGDASPAGAAAVGSCCLVVDGVYIDSGGADGTQATLMVKIGTVKADICADCVKTQKQ